jgi:hypothetical protein
VVLDGVEGAMKVIIGSYRGPTMVMRAVRSIVAHLIGTYELVIVDDSDNHDWVQWYRENLVADVIPLPRVGYTRAMTRVCREAGNERFIFWEEDFALTRDTSIAELSYHLDMNQDLAQIVLLRQPWFPNEQRAGSVVKAMEDRLGVQCETRDGLIVQDGTFSCNPAMWRETVAPQGWPQGDLSEDRMTAKLKEQGLRFAWLEGERVRHDGQRSGFGY